MPLRSDMVPQFHLVWLGRRLHRDNGLFNGARYLQWSICSGEASLAHEALQNFEGVPTNYTGDRNSRLVVIYHIFCNRVHRCIRLQRERHLDKPWGQIVVHDLQVPNRLLHHLWNLQRNFRGLPQKVLGAPFEPGGGEAVRE
ncbi:hypothetical protein FGO68_gene10368 [Halteria grandinella]|uniref:Uncharacterized protein n=1 Tax=Halteria grandinella TaxID=5974 RepID=A0A8J8P3K0_HALGN|nr:hypothetical protein FGO68_gene10368 [Halteria grandinella]